AASIGGGAIGATLDVTDRDAFAAFIEAAEDLHGPLGVIVNNAGVDWMSSFHEEPDEVSRREVEVNLLGTILGSRLQLQRPRPRVGTRSPRTGSRSGCRRPRGSP